MKINCFVDVFLIMIMFSESIFIFFLFWFQKIEKKNFSWKNKKIMTSSSQYVIIVFEKKRFFEKMKKKVQEHRISLDSSHTKRKVNPRSMPIKNIINSLYFRLVGNKFVMLTSKKKIAERKYTWFIIFFAEFEFHE